MEALSDAARLALAALLAAPESPGWRLGTTTSLHVKTKDAVPDYRERLRALTELQRLEVLLHDFRLDDDEDRCAIFFVDRARAGRLLRPAEPPGPRSRLGALAT